jgi:hypothetical protein
MWNHTAEKRLGYNKSGSLASVGNEEHGIYVKFGNYSASATNLGFGGEFNVFDGGVGFSHRFLGGGGIKFYHKEGSVESILGYHKGSLGIGGGIEFIGFGVSGYHNIGNHSVEGGASVGLGFAAKGQIGKKTELKFGFGPSASIFITGN